MKPFLMVVFMLALLAMGSYCLFFAREMQARAIRDLEAGMTAGVPIVRRFVYSNQYRIAVRGTGLIAYAMFLLFSFALLKGR